MQNSSNNEIKEAAKQQAGANTAKVAAKTAATYFGGAGAGKVVDIASNTKAGQAVLNTAGKVIAKTPGIGAANKKLNDTGLVDAADKVVDATSGKIPKRNGTPKAMHSNGMNTTDPANANQQSSLRNNELKEQNGTPTEKKSEEATNKLSRNKANQSKNRGIKRLFSNGSSSSNSNDEEKSEDNKDNETEGDLENVVKKAKTITVILSLAVPFLFFLLIVVVISAVISTILAPFASLLGTEGNEKNQTGEYAIGEEEYFNELERKISEYKVTYECSNDFELNEEKFKIYIHSIISESFMYNQNFEIDLSDFEDITDEKGESKKIRYDLLKKYIEPVIKLSTVDGKCPAKIDYKIDGYFFQNVLKSASKNANPNHIYKLYSKAFENITEDEKVKIFENIFNMAKGIYGDDETEDVQPETGDVVFYAPKGDTPVTTVNTLSGFRFEETYSSYLKGVLYALNNDFNDQEKLKSQMIVVNTNLLLQSNYSVTDENIRIDTGKMLVCNMDYGCHKEKDIFGIEYMISGPGKDGKYYKEPASDEIKAILNNVYDNVGTQVLLKPETTSELVYSDITKIEDKKYDNYLKLIGDVYPDAVLSDIREGNYITSFSLSNGKVFIDSKYSYDQGDYANTYFCGRSGEPLNKKSIAYAGCGITSMAIVASTLLNSSEYDPLYMNSIAIRGTHCADRNGTYVSFFSYAAKKLDLNIKSYSKSESNYKKVFDALLNGNTMVIINVGPGKFTSTGHYIVIGGYDSNEKKFYIYDPNNNSNKKSKRKSGNGWYDVNEVISQIQGNFYVISKG